MSAPMVWVLLPAGLGLALLLLAGSPRLTLTLGMAAAFLLAWAALLLPIDLPLSFAGQEFKLTPTYFVLGRTLTLRAVDQPLVMGVWGLTFVWLVGALFARPPRLFAPTVLLVVAILTAALIVEPFLYAALLFELAVLLSVPLLAPPGGRGRRAVLRMLAFFTIGMVFILFVGWMLEGAAASPGILALVVRAGVLLAIGFAFLLAIFPFHSWVPLLADEAEPYAAAFMLLVLPVSVALFGLELIDRFVWLRQSEAMFALLRAAGTLMAVVGGLFAGLERRLGRQLGFAVVLETGVSLLVVGAAQPASLPLFFAVLLPRSISLLVWAATLSNLAQQPGVVLSLDGMRGLAGRFPLRSAALLLAIFSLAGLPLLSGFPFRLLLVQSLVPSAPWAAGALLLGSFGLVAAGLRLISALVGAPAAADASPEDALKEQPVYSPPDFTAWLFISVAAAGSLLAGLFPHWFWPFFSRLPEVFNQLGR